VAVAGLGWAAVSAPAVLAPDDGGPAPSLALVVGGAGALGLATGAVLGAAQAWVIRSSLTRGLGVRGSVAHPWRWTGISALAWAPAMAVIFAGAQSAPAHWSTGAVALLGTATGALAGAALGAVCGALVPVLHDPT
jgi:hypothetical protein